MTFHRGAALTTATTLGWADTADLGPSAGNGFDRDWPDDLAQLQGLGLTDVRITLDWARLQQRPGGDLDADWIERFENILEAADATGLRVWATLYDGSVPRWFDNEGGLSDAAAFVKWWPRWVERAADRFGDGVHAWIPFDTMPPDAAQPWRDTWGILGGTQPVVASIQDLDHFANQAFIGRMDRLGLTLAPEWERDATLTDELLEQAADRWGTVVRDAADRFDDEPVVITGFRPGHDDHDECARIVDVLVTTLDLAGDDGVAVDVAFVEPAIAGLDSEHGLLDRDRAVTAMAEVYLASRRR